MGETTMIAEPGVPQVVMTREFHASPDVLFRAYTEPELISQWWGPRRFATTVDRFDLRHGGEWRFLNVDDDGNEYGFHGLFHGTPTVHGGVVQTWEFEGAPGHVHLETATFEEHDGGTRLIADRLLPVGGVARRGVQRGHGERRARDARPPRRADRHAAARLARPHAGTGGAGIASPVRLGKTGFLRHHCRHGRLPGGPNRASPAPAWRTWRGRRGCRSRRSRGCSAATPRCPSATRPASGCARWPRSSATGRIRSPARSRRRPPGRWRLPPRPRARLRAAVRGGLRGPGGRRGVHGAGRRRPRRRPADRLRAAGEPAARRARAPLGAARVRQPLRPGRARQRDARRRAGEPRRVRPPRRPRPHRDRPRGRAARRAVRARTRGGVPGRRPPSTATRSRRWRAGRSRRPAAPRRASSC